MKPVKGPGGDRGLLAGSWALNVAIKYNQNLALPIDIFLMGAQLPVKRSLALPGLLVIQECHKNLGDNYCY